MRYRELLEYKRDITLNKFKDAIIKRIENNKFWDMKFIFSILFTLGFKPTDELKTQPLSNWPEELINALVGNVLEEMEDADPTQNKQYAVWILQRYLDGSITRFEDISSTVTEFMGMYHWLKVRRLLPLVYRDLGIFKGVKDMSALYTSINNMYTDEVNKRGEGEQIVKGNAEEVLNNSEMRVIVPKNKEAACYYGKGTRWCTATTRSANYFDEYNKKGDLYIIIPKKNEFDGVMERYQLWKEDGGDDIQVMDADDLPVRLVRLFKDRFKEESSYQFFKDKGFFENQVFDANPELVKNVGEDIYKHIMSKFGSEIKKLDNYIQKAIKDSIKIGMKRVTSAELHLNYDHDSYGVNEIEQIISWSFRDEFGHNPGLSLTTPLDKSPYKEIYAELNDIEMVVKGTDELLNLDGKLDNKPKYFVGLFKPNYVYSKKIGKMMQAAPDVISRRYYDEV